MTTKQQEREALAKIQKIIAGLGENSYIGTALEGCLEIAEQNIENDWACSMKQRAESADAKLEVLETKRESWEITARDLRDALQRTKDSSQVEIEKLQKALDATRAQYEKTRDQLRAMESASKVRVVSRNSNAEFEYSNVVSVTEQNVKDLGYCRRILLDNGLAMDCWAQDWKVLKLDWVEV